LKKIVTLLLLCSTLFATARTKRVLFLGNSYTYVNNLPQITKDIALSAGDTLIFDVEAIGGATLEQHAWSNPPSIAKIAQGNWDYVVLQEQSQRPSFPTSQVMSDVFPPAKFLDSVIHHYNSCGRTMFYMTWGKKTGDPDNCPGWPYVCTYYGMDSLIRARYIDLADSNDALLSPVGAVWRRIRTNHPSIELYNPDESHPSTAGSYAAACAFYTAIFKKDPTLLTNNYGLNATQAADIRAAAKAIVFDSMAYWHIGEYDPKAGYTKALTGSQVVFTNNSVNATSYSWDFGDGQTSADINPTHTYTSAGIFNARLVAAGCNNTDTFQSIVDLAPAGIGNGPGSSFRFIIAPNPVSELLQIQSDVFLTADYRMEILDRLGRIVHSAATDYTDTQRVRTDNLASGVYFLRISGAGGVVYNGRFIKS
jgi:hypothetical protein